MRLCDAKGIWTTHSLPVVEVIVNITTDHKWIFVATEYNVFAFDKDMRMIRLAIPFRDRILATLCINNILLIVTARGCVHSFHNDTFTYYKTFALSEESGIYYSAAVAFDEQLGIFRIALGTIFSGILLARLNVEREVFCRDSILSGHKGSVFDLWFAQDNHLYSCSDDRSIGVWDLSEGGRLCHMITSAHDSRIWKISGDDKYFVTVSEDNTCKLWLRDGLRLCSTFEGVINGKGLLSVAILDSMLLYGSFDGSITKIDLSKSILQIFRDFRPSECSDNIKSLCLMENGEGVVFGTDTDGIYELGSNGKIKDLQLGIVTHSLIRQFGGTWIVCGLHGCIYAINETETRAHELPLKNAKISYIFMEKEEFFVEFNNSVIFIYSSETEWIQLDQNGHGNVTAVLKSPECWFYGTRNGMLVTVDGCNGKTDKVYALGNGESIRSIQRGDDGCLYIATYAGNLSVLSPRSETVVAHYPHVCKGILERIAIDPESGQIVIVSFYQKAFCLWSVGACQRVSSPRIITRINCGGGNRVWDVLFDWSLKCFHFAFVDSGNLNLFKGFLDWQRPVVDGYCHGREIRASCKVAAGTFASGSEDGLVVIWKRKSSSTIYPHCQYQCLFAIKCISTIAFDEYNLLFVGGSNESITVLKFDGVGLMFWGKCPEAAAIPETRIMSLDARISAGGVHVLMGYSDASVRLWRFETDSKAPLPKFTLIAFQTGMHHNRAVLNIKFATESSFITSGTDGHIFYWQISGHSGFRQISSLKVHESGINAVEIEKDVIATGGEDGSVAFLSFTHSEVLMQCKSLRHGSTVTGLKPLAQSRWLSSSVDGIIVAQSQYHGPKLFVQRTNVSDVSSILVDNDCAVIFGVGIEVVGLV